MTQTPPSPLPAGRGTTPASPRGRARTHAATRRKPVAAVVATVLALGSALTLGPGAGPAAAVDTVGFGLDQNFAANYGGVLNNRVTSMGMRPDGDIVVAGYFTSPSPRLALLHPDGTLDPEFDTNLGTGPAGSIRATVQGDGKTLVGAIGGVGDTNFNGTPGRVFRVNLDGTLDTTFRDALPSNTYQVWALAAQPDGKVVISIGTDDGGLGYRNQLLRLNTDGSRDATFSVPASLVNTPQSTFAVALSVRPDGKIVVGGSFALADGAPGNGLFQLNADGSPDTAFNTNLGTGLNAGSGYPALQSDGKIVVTGGFTSVNGVASNDLARINVDGTLDAAFAANVGRGTGDAGATVAAVQPDGKILVGGTFTITGGAPATGLARFLADGTPDIDYNAKIGTGFPPPTTFENILALLPLDNDRVLAGGRFTTFQGIAAPYLALVGPVHITITPPGNQATALTGTALTLPITAAVDTGGAVEYAATGLPDGLSIDPTTGVITGTPTTAGDYTVTLTVDQSFTSAASTLTFDWRVVAVTVTNPGNQTSRLGASVNLPVVATTTPDTPVTFTATGLPAGLTIDPTTGTITGTPTTTGTTAVTITATDPTTGATDTATLDWTIASITLTNPGDQIDAVGDTVTLPITASSSTGAPLEFTATGLPAGLSIDPTTGTITGTPTTPGTTTVTITATDPGTGLDDTATFDWTIVAVTLTNPGDQTNAIGDTITLPALASASDGGTLEFTATGLPDGLAIDTTTGAITGTPTTAGTTTVTLTATHPASGATASVTFDWTIDTVTVTVTNPGDQTTAVGAAVTLPVTASSSTGAALEFTATGLPDGLSIDPGTGVITGTPTTPGTGTVTVTATHPASGATGTATFDWTIVAVTLANPGDQTNAIGDTITLPAIASASDGGTLEFTATGLPDGLAINPTTGAITGTPTTPGTTTVTLTATHPASGATAAVTFDWTIAAVVVTVTNPGNQATPLGATITLPITASSSTGAPVEFTATGLPDGLSINPTTGTITGTPTTTGTTTVTITATHPASGATGTATFDWTIVAVTLTNPGDQADGLGEAITLPAVATATDGAALEFTATGLPDGLAIDPVTGTITGTLTTATTSTVTITATHPTSGASASVTFDWVVTAVAVHLSDPGPQTTALGANPTLTITATATEPGPIDLSATGLPPGLTLDPTTGTITGTTTSAGRYTVTITGTHTPTGTTASVSFTWDVITIAATNPGPQNDPVGTELTLPIAFSVTGAAPATITATGLPDGLSIDPDNGVITGTPTTPGTTTVTITITHPATGATATTTFDWTTVAVTIDDPGPQTHPAGQPLALAITATVDPTGDLEFTATGLPDGLAIDPTTGVITGTPTTGGHYPTTITATHPTSGATASVSFDWTIVQVTLTPPGDQTDPVAIALTLATTASSTSGAPLTFTATGLPDGLVIDPTTGLITGTPTTTGQHTVTITATEPLTGATTSTTFTWTIATLTIDLTNPGDQTTPVGTPATLTVYGTSSDGAELTYTATGLPPGLSIDPATITGTPTSIGTYTVTITATHPTGPTATTTFTWTITPTTTMTPAPSPPLGGALATTGASITLMVLTGAALIATGALLRRRRTTN